MRTLTERQHQLRYRKVVIDVLRDDDSETPVWINPQKTLLRVGAYVPDPETWAKRFVDVGQLASLKRGNKAVAVSFTPPEFDAQRELLKQFLEAAITTDVPPE